VTVPDLHAVEASHAAVIAAIDADGCKYGGCRVCKWCKRNVLVQHQADRALARLRRHDWCRDRGPWPCPDALDAWADLTDFGTTYGVAQ
jgi:hypothetical protein